MKLFCAALTAAPVTGDNSIVPIAIIAMAVVVVIAAVLLLGVPFPSLTYITIFVREMQHLTGKFYAKVKKFRAIWQI